MKPDPKPPVIVELTRAEVVESSHIVDVVVATRAGAVELWGDQFHPATARSAMKSIQAIQLITTGAADAFEVTDNELALACSSHSAEADHVEILHGWLARIGLSESDLECGPGRPEHQGAADEATRSGTPSSPILNCCSGKHSGFLTSVVHLGEDPSGYIQRGHPVQARVEKAVSAMTGVDLSNHVSGIDGCGVPVFSVPLERLAFAMARLIDPRDLDDDMASACQRLATLLLSRSHFVSGTDRCESRLAAVANQPLIAKTGAEGMFMAALPEHGLGIALKARDGAVRAGEQAIWGVLDHLGVFDETPVDQPLLNKAGNQIGIQRAVFPN